MPSPKENLLQVLRETRGLLALPDNDFAWSGWEDARAALTEMDFFISQIEKDRPFDKGMLHALFTVAGPIQEVSASSGWGDEFCRVAARFDHAMAGYEKSPPARKRSLLSQIVCPLLAMVCFFALLSLLPNPHFLSAEDSASATMEPIFPLLVFFVVPALVYLGARRIFD